MPEAGFDPGLAEEAEANRQKAEALDREAADREKEVKDGAHDMEAAQLAHQAALKRRKAEELDAKQPKPEEKLPE